MIEGAYVLWLAFNLIVDGQFCRICSLKSLYCTVILLKLKIPPFVSFALFMRQMEPLIKQSTETLALKVGEAADGQQALDMIG